VLCCGSAPCKQAAREVQHLREDFVEDDIWFSRMNHHHPHLGLFLFLSLWGLVALVWARKGRQRRQQVRALLEALNANPDLKAQIEAITGTTVPPKCGHHGHHARGGFGVCLFKLFLRLVAAFLSAVVLIHVSAGLTRLIIVHVSRRDEETGELLLPSPACVVGVLVTVLTTLTVLTAVALKALFRSRPAAIVPHYPAAADSETGAAPSAPQAPSSAGSPGGYVYNGFMVRSPRQVDAPEGYIALRAEEPQPQASSTATTQQSALETNVVERPVMAQFSTPVAIF